MTAMRIVLLILALLLLSGCVRTYRSETYSFFHTQIQSDGSVSGGRRCTSTARDWRGPWLLPPARLTP